MKWSWSNPFLRFIIVAPGVYFAWYALYEFYLQPHTNFDTYVIDNLVYLTELFLNMLGYELRPHVGEFANYVGLKDHGWIQIGAPCDGITLLSLLAVLVLAFPGAWKHKLWFLPFGLISVHLINVIRIICLVFIVAVSPESLEFHHDYTFTFLVYCYVFWLWYMWINKFSDARRIPKDETAVS